MCQIWNISINKDLFFLYIYNNIKTTQILHGYRSKYISFSHHFCTLKCLGAGRGELEIDVDLGSGGRLGGGGFLGGWDLFGGGGLWGPSLASRHTSGKDGLGGGRGFGRGSPV